MNIEKFAYFSATEAARMLGVGRPCVSRLAAAGKLPAVKVANRWLLPRLAIEEFSRTYEGKPGRPREKRKYTKRSEVWRRS